MIVKTMMTAAFALTVSVPAIAQMTGTEAAGSGSMSGSATGSTSPSAGGTQSGTMSDGAMSSPTPAPKMTKAEMASAKKCKAMSSEKMMKSSVCMKMQKAHPEMMSPGN